MLVNREMHLKGTIDFKRKARLRFSDTFFLLYTVFLLVYFCRFNSNHNFRLFAEGEGEEEMKKKRTKLFSLWTILLLILQELFLFKLQRSHSFGLIS